jgi:hypothetical protein
MSETETEFFQHLRQQVIRQLDGFGVEVFELGVFDAVAGKMRLYTQRLAQIPKLVPYYWEQRGHHLYLRPEGSRGIVLVDDVTMTTARRLYREGFEPSLVVETSPANYQVWVRLSLDELRPAFATRAAQWLARTYGGDRGAASWRQFGRLVGFPNVKEKYKRADGSYPLVKLHYAEPQIASAGSELLHFLAESSEEDNEQQTLLSSASFDELYELYRWLTKVPRLGQTARALAKLVYDLKWFESDEIDESQVDFVVCLKCLERGFPPLEIAKAIFDESPALAERKKGHIDDYIERTLRKAIAVFVQQKQP